MTSQEMSPSLLRERLANEGYVRIPNAVADAELQRLRAACRSSAERARAGKWPFVRTLPKQFPPWNSDVTRGIWGVQHLLHPDLAEHEIFAASYFSPTIITAVTAILSCEPSDLVMELYNLLVRPDQDFALRWHRDDVPPTISPQEEEQQLKQPILHTQWNLALYDDESLVAVPGSHIRARTDTERSADPFENNLPGQHTIKMTAGDAVFYNNNILHRGIYNAKAERMTLHGSMGLVAADPARARNVLQHGVGDWVDKCNFENVPGNVRGHDLAEVAEAMRERLMTMGSTESVGFSQNDQ